MAYWNIKLRLVINRVIRRRMINLFFGALIVVGCTTTLPSVEYGILPEHRGYIPARIAVLPCTAWSNGARYAALPNITTMDQIKDLCGVYDAFVISGFQNQPYLKGFSPKSVTTLLGQASKPKLLEELDKTWSHEPTDCVDCINAPSFYSASLSARPDWRTWLHDFSRAVRNADAVLIPRVTFARERRLNDRGILVAERSAEVVLMLVDSNNGLLLWSGGRQAQIANQRLENEKAAKDVDFPPWNELNQRLFIESLWKDFPGRQAYE